MRCKISMHFMSEFSFKLFLHNLKCFSLNCSLFRCFFNFYKKIKSCDKIMLMKTPMTFFFRSFHFCFFSVSCCLSTMQIYFKTAEKKNSINVDEDSCESLSRRFAVASSAWSKTFFFLKSIFIERNLMHLIVFELFVYLCFPQAKHLKQTVKRRFNYFWYDQKFHSFQV